MSLVEAALLDQERRVLEMDRESFKRIYCDHGAWGKMRTARAWCKRCGHGIGQTKPNRSGYCNARACQTACRADKTRMQKKRAA